MAITHTTAQIATRLSDEQRLRLERMARENDRSLAAELRRAVYFYLKHNEAEDGEN